MKPLVSILIPAYNSQEWIGPCLRSALAQTWEPKEIIVVDDGSKDGTLAAARQFEQAGVRVASQRNQGAAAARNTAYSLSRGEYIQWLDADDLISPDKIERQMAVAQQLGNKRLLLSCGWSQFLHRYKEAKFVPSALWADLTPADWPVRKMSLNLLMQTGTWLTSRELCEAAGPWDTRMLGDDDGEYFCRVLLASEGVRFVPEAKVYYRASGGGSLSYIGTSDRKRNAQWLSMQLHIRYIRSLEESERVHAACVTYLQNWMVFFYPERQDVFREAQEIARSLGGEVSAPRLSWKYAWIAKFFGQDAGWRAQVLLPRLKWSLLSSLDKFLYNIGGKEPSTLHPVTGPLPNTTDSR